MMSFSKEEFTVLLTVTLLFVFDEFKRDFKRDFVDWVK